MEMALTFWAVGKATKDGIKGCDQGGVGAIVVRQAQGATYGFLV